MLEFLQGEEHGEGLAVGVGRIEDDEGEAEAFPELGGEVVLALGRPEEESGKAGVLDGFLGGLHLDQDDLIEMAGQGGFFDRRLRLR